MGAIMQIEPEETVEADANKAPRKITVEETLLEALPLELRNRKDGDALPTNLGKFNLYDYVFEKSIEHNFNWHLDPLLMTVTMTRAQQLLRVEITANNPVVNGIFNTAFNKKLPIERGQTRGKLNDLLGTVFMPPAKRFGGRWCNEVPKANTDKYDFPSGHSAPAYSNIANAALAAGMTDFFNSQAFDHINNAKSMKERVIRIGQAEESYSNSILIQSKLTQENKKLREDLLMYEPVKHLATALKGVNLDNVDLAALFASAPLKTPEMADA